MKLWKIIMLTILGVVLAGCESERFPLNPELKYYSRKELERMDPLHLPSNWNIENFHNLRLGMLITDAKTGRSDRYLNTRLQTELAKLRRFTVYSAHNINGKMVFMDLESIGEVKLKTPVEPAALDFMLNVKLTVLPTVYREGIRKYFNYAVTCDWSLEDLATQTVLESGVAKGQTERLQIVSYNGGAFNGGFDDRRQDQVSDAVCAATLKAMAVVANRLGDRFPVGGVIKGVSASGKRLTLDKGFLDGIGRFHQCALFTRVGRSGRVAIPLGLAEAMPAVQEANLHIYKWNKANADARIVLQEYLANPQEYASKHELFAVGYGVPIPAEWEKDSTEADEKVLLRLK